MFPAKLLLRWRIARSGGVGICSERPEKMKESISWLLPRRSGLRPWTRLAVAVVLDAACVLYLPMFPVHVTGLFTRLVLLGIAPLAVVIVIPVFLFGNHLQRLLAIGLTPIPGFFFIMHVYGAVTSF